jgi:putative ABC transport system permease protein
MHFFPILSALQRHRTAAALIVLEIALTCAIVSNAVFLIGDRLSRMDQSSGIAETELVRVRLTGVGRGQTDVEAITAQDLTALRAIPGVRAAASMNMIPFGNSAWGSDVSTKPDDSSAPIKSAAIYMGGPDPLATLGVPLISGREFTLDEFVGMKEATTNQVRIPSVIITRAVAEVLFPGKSPLGQSLYVWNKEPTTVVGVIDHIARPNEGDGPQYAAYSVFLPIRVPYTAGSNYLLRVDPARRGEVLAAADAALTRVDPHRIVIERQTFTEIRERYFRQDRAMAYLLVGVSVALLIVTALGVIGLASFWVQQRTRQIGVRRALGATRGDIVRYFQTENFILATLGIILGMVLAYAINHWLMGIYQVPRLPAVFLPLGAVLLWGLGQIAVLGPALRASWIPPAIATRTV